MPRLINHYSLTNYINLRYCLIIRLSSQIWWHCWIPFTRLSLWNKYDMKESQTGMKIIWMRQSKMNTVCMLDWTEHCVNFEWHLGNAYIISLKFMSCCRMGFTLIPRSPIPFREILHHSLNIPPKQKNPASEISLNNL